MSLVQRLTNDYNTWEVGAVWSVQLPNIYAESDDSITEWISTAYKEFALSAPANIGVLSVAAKQYQAPGEDVPGYQRFLVILKKPDTSEVTLYDGTGGNNTWQAVLSNLDIMAHLSAVGTYRLTLKSHAKSGRDMNEEPPPPYEYFHSHTTAGALDLSADTDPPGQVQNVSIAAFGATTVTVQWGSVTGADTYTLYYKRAADPGWSSITGITDTSKQVTGLDVCTLYDFKVAAVNESGEGTHSSTVQQQTICPPGKVTGVVLAVRQLTAVAVQWNAVSGADTYTLYWKQSSSETWNTITGIPTYGVWVYDISPCTFHDFKVAAVNEAGEGEHSDVLQDRTLCEYSLTLPESLSLQEDLVRVPAKVFLEPLSLQDFLTVTLTPSILLPEQLNLQEHFFVQKKEPVVLQEEQLLAFLDSKDVQAFELGAALGRYDTDDLDFGYPGVDKTLDEVRFWSERTEPHTVGVYVSPNSGTTWTLVGQATVCVGVEGVVFCWVTAEKHRIRFEGESLYLTSYLAYAVLRGRKKEPDSD